MKVKHLIQRLSAMNPEANVYVGGVFDAIPAQYAHVGTRLPREKAFVTQRDSEDPGCRQHVDITCQRNGVDRSALTNEAVLITNWNGSWESGE